jgi:hypothetical protein
MKRDRRENLMKWRNAPKKFVAVFLMAIVCSGCAFTNMTKGYPGPERPLDELVVIRGTQDVVMALGLVSTSKSVFVKEVAGERCGSKLCVSDTSRAMLLPGRYDFTVKFVVTNSGGLVFQTLQEIENHRRGKDVVSFDVEAGHTYYLHFSEEDSLFYVSARNVSDALPGPTSFPLFPPEDAFPCVDRDLDPSAFCQLHER